METQGAGANATPPLGFQNADRSRRNTLKALNSSHSARLITDLSHFRVNGELAVGFFDDISELTPKGQYVVVKPRLFFGGERELRAYKDICNLFQAEKRTNI